MKVIFRADASLNIGTGHIGRDLALAEGLVERGFPVEFICRDLQGNLIGLLEQKGFTVHRLSKGDGKREESPLAHSHWLETTQNTDAAESIPFLQGLQKPIVIVDHYGLHKKWESAVGSFCEKLVVIDDLADRQHACDILIDHNLYKSQNRYENLVPNNCIKLLGPQYALLRAEFGLGRKSLRNVGKDRFNHLLVFMGGVDKTGETLKVLKALELLGNQNLKTTVIAGAQSPHRQSVENFCKSQKNTVLLSNVTNMAQVFSECDLMIGAGGSTTWERCCMGLPAVIITVAENQREAAKDMAELGFQYFLGHYSEVDEFAILSHIKKILADPTEAQALGKRCHDLVDGLGVSRILEVLLKGVVNVSKP